MVDRNAKPTFHPPAELQTAIEYIPIQGRQGGPQNFNNKRQAPPTDPGPSNSQDVRFIDGVVKSHYDDTPTFDMRVGEELGQWSPHTNTIIFELKSLGNEVIHEAPALAVTTRAMRRKTPLEVGEEGQEEYCLDEGLNHCELYRIAS